MNNIKKYIIGFVIGLGCVSGIGYASTNGSIGDLFDFTNPDKPQLLGSNILTGSISQNKLSNTLSGKINSITRDYNDLNNKPFIPTRVAELIDSGSYIKNDNEVILSNNIKDGTIQIEDLSDSVMRMIGSYNRCGGSINGYSIPTKLGLDGKCRTALPLHLPKANTQGVRYCKDGDEKFCFRYGALYTFVAAKNLCSSLGNGWALPTSDEIENMYTLGANVSNRFDGIFSRGSGTGRAYYDNDDGTWKYANRSYWDWTFRSQSKNADDKNIYGSFGIDFSYTSGVGWVEEEYITHNATSSSDNPENERAFGVICVRN